jgi:hypothetical protein
MYVFACVKYIQVYSIYSRETEGRYGGRQRKGVGGDRWKMAERRERDGESEERVGCQETATSGGQKKA